MKTIFSIVAAAALACLPLTASADALRADVTAPVSEVSAADAAGKDQAKDKMAPVSLSDLAGMSGGADTHVAITEQTLSATNSGNTVSADQLVTGNVNLGAGTFSGFNGVGNFVFNTGNNNNVQGSLSVTVMAPATLP